MIWAMLIFCAAISLASELIRPWNEPMPKAWQLRWEWLWSRCPCSTCADRRSAEVVVSVDRFSNTSVYGGFPEATLFPEARGELERLSERAASLIRAGVSEIVLTEDEVTRACERNLLNFTVTEDLALDMCFMGLRVKRVD